MRVLCVYPNKTDATSWYRGAGVFGELVRDGVEITNATEITWTEFVGKDIMFFQRPTIESHTLIMQLAKENNKKVVIDYDDLLFEVPEHNKFHIVFKDKNYRHHFVEALKSADKVIASTSYMKDYMINVNGIEANKIEVIRNAFNDYVFNFDKLAFNYNKMVMWRGTATHDKDLDLYKDDIIKIIDDNKDFKFVFIAYCPDWSLGKENVSYIKPTDVILYMNNIRKLNPSISFCPLEDIPFNRAKSNIAKIEATWAGSVSLNMDFDEWNWSGNKDYIIEKDLYTKLNALIDRVRNKDESLAKEYEINYNYIKDNLMLSNLNKDRLKLLRSVL